MAPEPWLEDVLDFLPLGDDLDVQNSSILFVQDLREAQYIVKASQN